VEPIAELVAKLVLAAWAREGVSDAEKDLPAMSMNRGYF